MHEQANQPSEQHPRQPDDLEDRSYHDDDEVVPADDGFPRAARPPRASRPGQRLPPPRRRFADD